MKNYLVKWFNDAKGYGFIVDELGNEIFVHYSVIVTDGYRTLLEGEEVQADVDEKRKMAKKVITKRNEYLNAKNI